MKQFLKIATLVAITAFMTQSVSGYDPSKHQRDSGGKRGDGKGQHHGYGRPKGPPADIPAHIKERTSPDGKGINLNNSQVGVKGIAIMAEIPELKNVVSMALKSNKLGDEGVKIMTQSDTFRHLEFLSLWDNGISAAGAAMLARGANFNNLKELNLFKNHLGDEGVMLLVDSTNIVHLTSLDLGSNKISDEGAIAIASSPYL
ncbi:uncharacterized protein METZ01_LOCUS449998, partial [marine metagenome]